MAKSKETGTVKVTLIKSTIACKENQIKTVEALGLSKIGQTKEMPNNAATQGMLYRVRHLVKVEE